MQQPIEVIAGAVFNDDNEVLLARRAEGNHKGMWEFPGGKRRDGETDGQCLRRELSEELGIDANIGAHIATSTHQYEDAHIRLSAYYAVIVSGCPTAQIHSEIRWVPVKTLPQYRLAPADEPIAAALLSGHCENG